MQTLTEKESETTDYTNSHESGASQPFVGIRVFRVICGYILLNYRIDLKQA
jgi:hypothetical protein